MMNPQIHIHRYSENDPPRSRHSTSRTLKNVTSYTLLLPITLALWATSTNRPNGTTSAFSNTPIHSSFLRHAPENNRNRFGCRHNGRSTSLLTSKSNLPPRWIDAEKMTKKRSKTTTTTTSHSRTLSSEKLSKPMKQQQQQQQHTSKTIAIEVEFDDRNGMNPFREVRNYKGMHSPSSSSIRTHHRKSEHVLPPRHRLWDDASRTKTTTHRHTSRVDHPDDVVVPPTNESREEVETEQQQRQPAVSSSTSDFPSDVPNREKEIQFARILLLAAAALYGTNFTIVKVLDETVPVGASTSLRFVMAALATLPWLLAPSKQPPTDDTNGAIMDNNNDKNGMENNEMKWLLGATLAGFEIGIWNSVGYISQAIGLETIDASKSAFICSLAVVFVPILDALTGKVMSTQKTIGAAMAVAGVGFLELGGMDAASASLSSGDIASLLQPIAFGIGFWRMEHAMRRYPTEAMRLTAGQLSAVAIVSVIFCALGVGGVSPPSMDQVVGWVTDPVIFGELVWTGLVTTALTIYMETLALKTLSAAETTLIFSTEPIWGAAFAAAVVGERFGLDAAAGAALILGGCLFSNIQFGKEEHGMDGMEEQQDSSVKESLYVPTEKYERKTRKNMAFMGGMDSAFSTIVSQLQNSVDDGVRAIDTAREDITKKMESLVGRLRN